MHRNHSQVKAIQKAKHKETVAANAIKAKGAAERIRRVVKEQEKKQKAKRSAYNSRVSAAEEKRLKREAEEAEEAEEQIKRLASKEKERKQKCVALCFAALLCAALSQVEILSWVLGTLTQPHYPTTQPPH